MSEQKWLPDFIKVVAKECPLLLKGEDARFISNIALVMNPPKLKVEKIEEQ